MPMSFYLVQFLTGLASASSLFLVAVGLSLIFGVTRIVNLAHGSFYMLGAYIAHMLVTEIGTNVAGFLVAVVGGALVVGLLGVAMEVLLLRRIYRAPELFQLVATFGVVLIVKDSTRAIWGVQDKTSPALRGTIPLGDQAVPVFDVVFIAIGAAVFLAIWLLMRKTRWGTLVRAATQDRDMVGALGVNQKLLFTSVLFVGAALAGLGGSLQMLRPESVNLSMDLLILAPAFVVVVVGGMGSIGGAYLAAFIIAELNAFGVLVLPKITLVLMFLVMAVVLVVRPWGLLGKRAMTVGGHAGTAEPPLRPATLPLKLLYAALGVALLLLPLAGESMALLATEILVLVLFAASLHFIAGPGGMHSFGHAAYFGLGAYGAALLVKHAPALAGWLADALLELGITAAPLDISRNLRAMELGILAAPLLAALGALIVGWLAARLSGVYFAMLTLAAAQIIWSYAFQSDFTDGENGILGLRRSGWVVARETYYYLVLVVSAGGVMLLRKFLFAPFGYTMRAGRDSPRRADAIGIDTRTHQWLAFTLAGAFAGMAGGLFAYSKGSVFPDILDIPHSFDPLYMVMLGGVHTLAGPVVGAAAFEWLRDIVKDPNLWGLIGARNLADYWQGMLGLLIVVIVLAFPQGIAGFLRDRVGTALGFVRREELAGARA
jgi:branched-chain amino acid transport system permease protein